MKVNVENIKVLKVETDGYIRVYEDDLLNYSF